MANYEDDPTRKKQPVHKYGNQPSMIALLVLADALEDVRKSKQEKELVSRRLEAAFGAPVSIENVDLLNMRLPGVSVETV